MSNFHLLFFKASLENALFSLGIEACCLKLQRVSDFIFTMGLLLQKPDVDSFVSKVIFKNLFLLLL